MRDIMKRILDVIFAILLFTSCEKNEVLSENPIPPGKLISFSPNMTNTRGGDYSWDDYYRVCPDVTVYMTLKGSTSMATYKYNDTNKLLEYEDGELLYYPIDNEPYQLIVLWPAKSIQELYGEHDYHNQNNFESFLRSDQLSDTINNSVRMISSVFPVYFKHSRSKISFILHGLNWKSWKFPDETKINNKPPYFNWDSTFIQIIYDHVKEGISKKDGIIQFDVQVSDQSYIYSFFHFDVSTLKAGVDRTVLLTYPYPFLEVK
ncbi:hypothetical protein EZS27_007717 [termite gut metagenome]|uniref:Uncharacterized protein n=1 Tax=termite gut metagenome TaxID=433724 RepID=A0A5J4SH95_9ZZZZ